MPPALPAVEYFSKNVARISEGTAPRLWMRIRSSRSRSSVTVTVYLTGLVKFPPWPSTRVIPSSFPAGGDPSRQNTVSTPSAPLLR